uniref:RNA-directed RNA polymerase n=2 Tax=Tombusviridae TaxID=39738 RepID=A0A6B9Q470_9TOMB|nr:RdRp [Plasmopara viticola lesion associated tombus-like virus 2]QLL27745.1 putative RdRp [Leveillula taurica associated tombus-like virus 1]
MKGMNASQVGAEFRRKWERMGGDGVAAAIGLDASRFDQHVSVEALQWEHEFYYSLCSDPSYRKQLRLWLSWQLKNKGFGNCSDGSLKYEVDGTRCSGDMNTGMGNCLIASCLLIAYCRERGVGFELANNGDDCVIFIKKRDINKFSIGLSHWFTEMGFNMVVEAPVFQLERVVFCQAQPVFDGFSWTMVRDPRTCIAKDCVSLKPWRNEKEYTSWIKCVGLSGTSLAGGIPVLDSFYRSFVRAGGDAKPLSLSDPTLTGGLFWAAKGMNRRHFSVSDDARVSFYTAFGITPDEQVCLEEEYNSSTPFYAPVEFDPVTLPVKQHYLL